MYEVEALADVRNVSKRFGATTAVSDVSLQFRPGEVHALVGENGAGKSTLGNLILGVHQFDAGEILVDGIATKFHSPADAMASGFVGVAQELSLLPSRSVLDNLVLGVEQHIGPFVNIRANRRWAESAMARLGHQFDLDKSVGELTVADQQRVEILRALARDARLIVLDEPTARLSSHEALEFRKLVREIADAGSCVIYVSHFLDEVLAVADVITVMRDGRVVSTKPARNETRASLVQEMTGRALDSVFPVKQFSAPDHAPTLEVDGLGRNGEFRDISFQIRPGEILGFAGLVGAGRSELAHAIYGSTKSTAGSVSMSGRKLSGSIPESIEIGMSLIPESRRDQGLIETRSVKENITLPHLKAFTRLSGIDVHKESETASGLTAQTNIKCDGVEAAVGSLSGGNQQKVLFARSMVTHPQLLIADEPTRGVDVGSKQAIYELIVDLARQGSAVMLISSEIEEVLGLSHRVIVMRGGRAVGEFEGDELTESNILRTAFDVESDATTRDADEPGAEN